MVTCCKVLKMAFKVDYADALENLNVFSRGTRTLFGYFGWIQIWTPLFGLKVFTFYTPPFDPDIFPAPTTYEHMVYGYM